VHVVVVVVVVVVVGVVAACEGVKSKLDSWEIVTA
jgi:hypothetical protein